MYYPLPFRKTSFPSCPQVIFPLPCFSRHAAAPSPLPLSGPLTSFKRPARYG